MRLPDKGLGREEILTRMEEYGADDLATHGGRTWAYVYDSGLKEVEDLAREAYLRFLSPNGLDPTVFPSLVRLERDLIGLAAAHLQGGETAVGSFTSGGTESCLLAVKTARDWARLHRPEIQEPEMILPVTAHAAFHKAAAYFGVGKVLVEVDPETFKADPAAIKAAIGPRTILLVGSAASYAHGVIDPIQEMGRLALEKGLLFHVDGCVGAWLLPFFRRLGAEVPDFDFSVPGVTSISMDFHKYAYCPKGASMIMYRNKELRKPQLFACAEWTGYTVINPTILSSKTGGPLAAAWATINAIGDQGYLEIARRTMSATEKVIKGLGSIPELKVLGRPEFCLVAFTSDTISVFELIDEMKDRAWYVQPQLSFSGSQENIHLSVSAVSLERVEGMLADLKAGVARIKDRPKAGPGDLEALLSNLDPSSLEGEGLSQVLSLAGIQGGRLPERMAVINQLLNSLPAGAKERLLIEYFNELYTQP